MEMAGSCWASAPVHAIESTADVSGYCPDSVVTISLLSSGSCLNPIRKEEGGVEISEFMMVSEQDCLSFCNSSPDCFIKGDEFVVGTGLPG